MLRRAKKIYTMSPQSDCIKNLLGCVQAKMKKWIIREGLTKIATHEQHCRTNPKGRKWALWQVH